MKKFIKLCVPLLLCLLLLCGCGCEHEWEEASCLTPKTCTKCDEVEGEALGHNWKAATCAAPETCSRCGETQGETLPHTYGKWVMGDTEMTHTCDVCGAEESAEIDREVYLRQELVGHWDFYAMIDGNQQTSALQLADTAIGLYVSVSEDGSLRLFNGQGLYTGTWAFTEYQEYNGSPFYYFQATMEDGSTGVFAWSDPASEDMLALYFSQTQYALFTKNQAVASALEGTWGGAGNGKVYSITFSPDRTFTANLDKTFSGTWHLRPAGFRGDGRYVSFSLLYTLDGVEYADKYSIYVGNRDTDMEEYLPNMSWNMNIEQESVTFYSLEEGGLAKLEAATKDGPTKILGDWTSKSVSTYSSGNSEESVVTDYTISFSEDGTFTAHMEEDRSGTWEFRNAEVRYGTTQYNYRLKFNGSSSDSYASLTHESGLRFSTHDGNVSTYYSFDQLSAEDIAKLETANAEAPKKILGKWTSTSLNTYIYETQSSSNQVLTDYSITFQENGTFTAAMDQDYTGVWELDSVDMYSGYTTYCYTLSFDGISDTVYASLGEDGQLNFGDHTDDYSRTIMFSQMTDEQKSAVESAGEDADALLIGSWNSKVLSTYENDTSTTKILTDYTIDFASDGTFTASLDKGYTGTWEFSHLDVNTQYNFSTYRYSLKIDGIHQSVDVMIDNQGDLMLNTYSNNISKSLYFDHLSADDIKALKKGPDLAIGTWSVSSASMYNQASGSEKNVDTSGSLTVSPDGTFQADLNTSFSGTWRFYNYSPEQGHMYLFTLENSTNGNIFYVRKDGSMSAYVNTPEGYIDYILIAK